MIVPLPYKGWRDFFVGEMHFLLGPDYCRGEVIFSEVSSCREDRVL